MKRMVTVLALLMAGCVCANPGEGEKVGTIVKMARTGLLCDTWEAELIRGGFTSGSGAMGVTPFDFTLAESQVDTVRKLMERNVEVKLHYRSQLASSPCKTDTGHFLESITPLGK